MKEKAAVKWIIAVISLLAATVLLSGCVYSPETESTKAPSGQQDIVVPTYYVPASVVTPVPTVQRVTDAPATQRPTNGPSGVTNAPDDRTAAPAGPSATPTMKIVTQAPTEAPKSLKLGANGQAVRNLQTKLKKLGFYKGNVDGDFGVGTEKAVKEFQAQYGLTVDGKAGADTLAKLDKATATKKPTASPTGKKTATPKKTSKKTATPKKKTATPRKVTATPKRTATPRKVTATPKKTATPTKKVTATPTVKRTATPNPSSFKNVFLKLGDKGNMVKQMQTRLISLGYMTGKPTGVFDELTEKAVIAFQKRSCPYSDGIAGEDTLTRLYSAKAKKASRSEGMLGDWEYQDEGEDVTSIQKQLKRLGYMTAEATGYFGTATRDAVKSFQNKNGLPVTGKVDATTLAKMFDSRAVKANGTAVPKQTATPKKTNTPKPTVKPTATPKKTATPKPTKTPKRTETPDPYREVTQAPNQKYVSLREGNRGKLVERLQQGLKDKGYFSGNVTGYYGEETAKAVKRYQKDKGYAQDGVASPAMQRTLFEGDFPDGA